MTASRPLPGIGVEGQPRPLADSLPRMDIPIFAGFTASGPLHVPVPVEDPAQFAMVFSEDVELPQSQQSREPRYSNLGPCVRAFFRNGGRRCWIVRVAGAAETNRFSIPGLTALNADGTVDAAPAFARCEGSWSDGLTVRTNLVEHELRLERFDAAGPRIEIASTSKRDATAGDLLRLSWTGSPLSFYFFVSAASPRADHAGVVHVSGNGVWIAPGVGSPVGASAQFQAVEMPAAVPSGTPSLARLTFDIIARRGNDRPTRLANLGFSPWHPRYFGALPFDAMLYEDPTRFADGLAATFAPLRRLPFEQNFAGVTAMPDAGWPDLWKDAAQPRFPLAVLAPSASKSTYRASAYLPLGMTVFASAAETAHHSDKSAIERNGLESYGAELFCDARLRDVSVRNLLDQADAYRLQGGPPLTGIHAALTVDEATMLAVPDAAHGGWSPDVAAGGPVVGSPPAAPAAAVCDAHGERASGAFTDCEAQMPLPAPVLTAGEVVDGGYTLSWDSSEGASEELQEATREGFSDATSLTIGASHSIVFYDRPPAHYYYRIRRTMGRRTSAWSAVVAVHVTTDSGFAMNVVTDDDPVLVDIHRAMIRMCAARGDLVALLSMPQHWRSRAAIAHVAKLATIDAVATDAEREGLALTYAAIWHPWLIGRESDGGSVRAMPPDGAIAGVMAARANRRGAWVAPANEPLRGIVSLTPAISSDDWQALQDAAVNVIRQDASGFICLDADTLTSDELLRPLNVRRLLILVRRAALRAGNDYAFEPNSTTLRTTVKRGFEAMLAGMFLRGAFAGRTAAAAYQVITDETINTRQSVDEGRLIAELRIAPSRPLSFLTIRLLRRGDATAVQEVR